MAVLQNFSTLVLRYLIDGACKAVGVVAVGSATDAVVAFLASRFTDHSTRLTQVLERANERSWKALEVARRLAIPGGSTARGCCPAARN